MSFITMFKVINILLLLLFTYNVNSQPCPESLNGGNNNNNNNLTLYIYNINNEIIGNITCNQAGININCDLSSLSPDATYLSFGDINIESNLGSCIYGTDGSLEIGALPIELVDFYGVNTDKINHLSWVTASEINNDYFIVENSIDGYIWNTIGIVKGAGNTSTGSLYNFNHEKYKDSINYYRLKQVDFDGQNETFKVISIDNRIEPKVLIKVVNFLGQTVTNTEKGVFIEIYSDGTTRKIFIK